MTEAPWPSPPRDSGAWTGGPPVGPAITGAIDTTRPVAPGTPQTPPPPRATPSTPLPPPPPPFGGVPPQASLAGHPGLGRSPLVLRVVAIVVILAAFAGGLYVVMSDDGRFPDEWDPEVAPYAAYVERTRGIEFTHPVNVRFMTAEEYSERTRSSERVDEVDEETRAELDTATAAMRAMGLVDGDVDLSEVNDTIADSGTLAFYDTNTKEVYVRGTELTPGIRVTLVHELTHALQDQAFDLARLGDLPGHASATLRAMAEGDAGRIEAAYIAEELTAEERREQMDEAAADAEGADEDLDGVPAAILAVFSAPYAFGPGVVALAAAEGGNGAVDDLFEDPPSEFALFDPMEVSPALNPASEQEILEIALPEGAEELDESSFGPVTWLIVMASRIDPVRALAATRTIEADGYRSYRRGDRVCVTARGRVAADADVELMGSAMRDWAAAMPGADAEVHVDDQQVAMTSCDPGAEATTADLPLEILGLASARAGIYTTILEQGGRPEFARCYSKAVEDIVDLDMLVSGQQVAPDDLDAAARSCR